MDTNIGIYYCGFCGHLHFSSGFSSYPLHIILLISASIPSSYHPPPPIPLISLILLFLLQESSSSSSHVSPILSISSESRVCFSNKLITSRGPGTAMEFALAIVKVLQGPEMAEKISAPMILPPKDPLACPCEPPV